MNSATSKGKTAFKKGGEAAMKEVGKDFAKDMAKNIAREVSQFASDVLSLEEWAKSTIGIGFDVICVFKILIKDDMHQCVL